MTKRKRSGKQRITAAMLPLIRDHAAATLDDRARFYDAAADDPAHPLWQFAKDMDGLPPQIAKAAAASIDGVAPEQVRQFARTYRAESAALRSDSAVLWYVTEAVTNVAVQAAPDLPDWSPSMARPARSGVIVWAGTTGKTAPVPSPSGSPWEARDGVVVGAWWDFDADTGEFGFTPLVRSPHDQDAGPGGIAPGDLGRTVFTEDMTAGFSRDLWSLIGATWLLAQSPTVGHTWGIRYDRRDPDRPFAKPTMPSAITVVTLREVATRDEPGDAWDDGLTRQSRSGPTYRHLVRGHWRQQPCGPGRKLRKPVFVAPFARGPGELVTKPTVHVWRR